MILKYMNFPVATNNFAEIKEEEEANVSDANSHDINKTKSLFSSTKKQLVENKTNEKVLDEKILNQDNCVNFPRQKLSLASNSDKESSQGSKIILKKPLFKTHLIFKSSNQIPNQEMKKFPRFNSFKYFNTFSPKHYHSKLTSRRHESNKKFKKSLKIRSERESKKTGMAKNQLDSNAIPRESTVTKINYESDIKKTFKNQYCEEKKEEIMSQIQAKLKTGKEKSDLNLSNQRKTHKIDEKSKNCQLSEVKKDITPREMTKQIEKNFQNSAKEIFSQIHHTKFSQEKNRLFEINKY